MAERVINQQRRRSEFFSSFAPVLSFDELIKHKLVSGKFPLTKTGWIKIIAVIVSLASLSLFLGTSTCPDTANWYPYLFPITVGCSIAIELFFYIVFSLGYTVTYPGRWVKADILLNLIFAILAIISSIFTITECTNDQSLYRLPGPLGITGGILSIVGCGAIFLMYRYVEDDNYNNQQRPDFRNTRKSIQA